MATAPTTEARRRRSGRTAGTASRGSCASPNFGPRPAGAQIDLIVLHSISLPPGRYGGDEVQQLFTNRWTGTRIPTSRRIRGHRGLGALLRAPRRRAVAVRQLRRPRLACRRVELARPRATATTTRSASSSKAWKARPSKPRSTRRWRACARRIAQRYPIAHVAGHEHIAPGRKHDPGARLRLARCCRRSWAGTRDVSRQRRRCAEIFQSRRIARCAADAPQHRTSAQPRQRSNHAAFRPKNARRPHGQRTAR